MFDLVAGSKHCQGGHTASERVNILCSSQMSTCDKTTDGCRSLAFRLPRGTRERQKQNPKVGTSRPTIHLDRNLTAVKVAYSLSVVVLSCM